MNTRAQLPAHLTALLQEADRNIQALGSGSRYPLYHFLRVTAGRIARTDAFYVGFYRKGGTMVFPYNYDGQEYDDPDEIMCTDAGLPAWIARHRKAYWSQADQGTLLNKGVAFGDMTRRSEDAVAVPILEPVGKNDQQLLGVLSMQSYQPAAYTEDTVRAFQWLADSVGLVLYRERQDERRRQALGGGPAAPYQPEPFAHVVQKIGEMLGDIRRSVDAASRLADQPDAPIAAVLASVRQQCEQSQTDVIELLLGSVLTKNHPISSLTEREREIVVLLTQDYSNRQIAEELGVDVETVKTHVGHILAKFGVKQRAGVTAIMRGIFPYPPSSDPPKW